MRWVGWLVAAVVGGGCTAINTDFENQQDSAATDTAGDRGTTRGGTSDPEVPQPTTVVTGAGEATGDPPTLTTAGDTGTSTAGEAPGVTSSSDSTESGDAESEDVEPSLVVFIFAAEDWMDGGIHPPTVQASDHCTQELASRCGSEEAVALLRQPNLSLATIISGLPAPWLALPVFGIESPGDTPLAASPADLLIGLDITLSGGGVNDPGGDATFFSGGPADDHVTCEGWYEPTGVAYTGSFNDETPTWFTAGGTASCTVPQSILCLCLSEPDPF